MALGHDRVLSPDAIEIMSGAPAAEFDKNPSTAAADAPTAVTAPIPPPKKKGGALKKTESKAAVVTSKKPVDLKIVAVGDVGVGKTSLFRALVHQPFSEKPISEPFNAAHDITIETQFKGTPLHLDLWEVRGSDSSDESWQAACRDADVVLVVFSLVNRATFTLMQKRFLQKVRDRCPTASVIIVGNKLDSRKDSGWVKAHNISITTEEDMAPILARATKTTYCEASAKTGEGVRQVFEAAAVAVLHSIEMKERKRRRDTKDSEKKCSLM